MMINTFTGKVKSINEEKKMVASLILGKKKRITNVKNKTMPYNNSPAKKYGPLKMDHGPKMMGKKKSAFEAKGDISPIMKHCGSKRLGKK